MGNHWNYSSEVAHDDGDTRKLDHIATNGATGETKIMDYSPHWEMPLAVFRAFVALGFPARPGPAPWSETEVLDAAQAQGVMA